MSENVRNPEAIPSGEDSEITRTPPAGPAPRRFVPVAEMVPLAVVIAAIVLSYFPNIRDLVGTWNRDPDYSHGYLVIPIALAIFYRLWPGLEYRSTSLVGWGLVVAGLAARYLFYARGNLWSENATLFPVIVGLGLARLGWPIFSRVWPGFAFLIFLFPLPTSINAVLSQPLQKVATILSCTVLKATGLWVMSEGNVILVDSERLEVQAACNGLAMLMSLSATVVAAACLIPMTHLKRAVLLVSIIPVALISNVLRISATAWCYHLWGAEVGSKYAHDAAGWLMMPTAMVLVGLELAIVSWLFIESTPEEKHRGLIQFGQPMPNLAGGRR